MRVLVAGLGRLSGAAALTAAAEATASYAEAIQEQYAGTDTTLGGFLAAATEMGLDVLPLSVVDIGSAPAVRRDTLETLRTRIFSELRGWKIDAVYLALHGATPIVEDGDSGDGGKQPAEPDYAEAELIRAMRARLGPEVALAASFDAAPAPAVAQAADEVACVVPQTPPAAEAAAQGAAAARALRERLREEVRLPAQVEEIWLRRGPVGPALPAGPRRDAQPAVHMILPSDPAPAAAPGEIVPLGLAVGGLAGRRVSAGWFICDELGEVRWDTREERTISDDPALLPFAWPVQRHDPPGVYSLRAMLWSPDDRWQGIASGTIEVVDAASGRRAGPTRFPPVPRDSLLAPRCNAPATPPNVLEALFDEAERACRAARNADGSWGTESRDRRGPQHIAIYTRTAENATAYLYAYRLFGRDAYAAEAKRGLDFLVETQLDNGGWCPWTFTWVTPQWVFLREACFYDTGSVARALLEGHAVLGDSRYLHAVRRAAEYALTVPYTGNNNYDAFLLWYLAPYARLTGEAPFLEHAVARCREAVLPGQQPYGGFPAHNLSTGYQAIIAFGLLALHQALGDAHPYKGDLRRATLMALNFLLWLQDDAGNFYSGWEYDRTFGVTHEGRPRGTATSPANGRLVEIFRGAASQFELHERVYRSLCHSVAHRRFAAGAVEPRRGRDLLSAAALLAWGRGLP
ncbi:MAG: M81 family metallopeptidase [Chloroflexi bacterium]|nr:M81 family metallopeptidase [Chloroflexota bacterium]